MAHKDRRVTISFGNYIKELCRHVFSSSLVLGLIVGVALVVAGDTDIEVNLTFEFDRFEGIWWMLGVPVLSLLILVVLSPLSFLVHRQLPKMRGKGAQPDPKSTNASK